MATIKIPEQKVILCGEYGVGKSSIFRRFANNTFVTGTDRQSTLGLDHYDKVYTVGNKDIKVNDIENLWNIFQSFLFEITVTAVGYWWYGTSGFYNIKLL